MINIKCYALFPVEVFPHNVALTELPVIVVFIIFCATFAVILNLMSFSVTAVEENLKWKLR